MAHIADQLKEKGNALFKSGDFAGAEEQYTLALQRYSQNPLLFTNRAFSRIKLQKWDEVVSDCLHSIELTGHGQNYKAYFYLAQAQLALNHPYEALTSAHTAYDQVMHPSPATAASTASSIPVISALVLKCKRSKFAAQERERLSHRGDLLSELEASLTATRDASLSSIQSQLQSSSIGVIEASEQRTETLDLYTRKVSELRSVFALADPENHAEREVPDYLVDTISFELMHDPVVTKNGHSYERATIVEHLKRSPTDPLTREPLTIGELRPNIALRRACEEFWEEAGKKGWTGDW